MSIYHSALKPEGVKLVFFLLLVWCFIWWCGVFFFCLISLIQLLKLGFGSVKPLCLS